MFIYSRFEALIRETGVTKASIARRIGRTPTVCQDWKAGKSEPSADQLQIVAAALGTTHRPVRRTRSTHSSGSFFPMLTMI